MSADDWCSVDNCLATVCNGPHVSHFCPNGDLVAQRYGDPCPFCGVVSTRGEPIPMRLPCPSCGVLHLDVGEFATKPHHTHACQECGEVWRPAVVSTVGVRFLPGFKNADPSGSEPT